MDNTIYTRRIKRHIAEKEDQLKCVNAQLKAANENRPLICMCGKQFLMQHMFRCLYCGEWFCKECAEAHFGQTQEEYDDGT